MRDGYAGSASRRAILAGGGAALLGAALGGPARAAKARPVAVALVASVPIEQQWISRIHLALKAAEARGDVTYVYSENVANTDAERVIREYAEGRKDLIVGEAFGLERPARKIAGDYKATAFLMGSSFPQAAPNFSVFDNYIQDASYLTGIVAGKETRTNLIGMVGGYAIPEVNRLMQAFMAGAKSVNPDVRFLVSFINSWYDPPKAKETAFAMIERRADVLYAERFGVSDAAKERGVKAIGNVIDTAAQYPGTVIASALWNMQPTIDRAVGKVIDGSFAAENYGPWSHMDKGGCSLAPLDPRLVPQAVIDMVLAREAEIRSGAFPVAVNDAEPKSTA
ncbi:Purine-binding protein [Methylobacterium crusticola]|uniref:Purine-binding protein n=1 Tax=Methylobacterium crusticola TaxID=1697972 RepID=A0ABQ4R414_9HYPH|nr:BMP family protein [Methylobacterium crusticola]GJD51487.1 Purine-binding protein [Methylobacterium crusticola]